jgi:hypothetical protein
LGEWIEVNCPPVSGTANDVITSSSPPMSHQRKLRFGIMCDDLRVEAWQAEVLRSLLRSGVAEPVLLIRKEGEGTPRKRDPLARIGRLLAPRFRRNLLWHLYLRAFSHRSKSTVLVDFASEIGAVDSIVCRTTVARRHSEYFAARDVDLIRSRGLDFILKFGFGIIRGPILAAAKYGVWSYHHDDERLIRGSPACFWEVVHGYPTTGSILQRLTETLDGGVVLHRGAFDTHWEYFANRDRAYFGSADWCTRACKDILAGSLGMVCGEPTRTDAPIYRAPRNLEFARFAGKQIVSLAQSKWRDCFCHDIWNVGYVAKDITEILSDGQLSGVRWAPSRGKYRFIADPFIYPGKNETMILVEEFDYVKTGKGTISALSLTDLQESNCCHALDRTYHLSYPYIFQDSDEIYCVPETYEAKRCDLYRLAENGGLVYERTMLKGIAVVDPTVFWHAGRWWLFGTDAEEGDDFKLYAYYAHGLAEEWLPHMLNPLKCDVTSARPAGTPYSRNGVLYRPAQDCSRTYGRAVVINCVTELAPDRFAEHVVARIEPETSGPYPHGFHTINIGEAFCVVDGKRTVTDLAWFFKRRTFGAKEKERKRAIQRGGLAEA